MNDIENTCDSSDLYCMNCTSRYCTNSYEKFRKLMLRTLDHVNDGLFWIDIDFEESDTNAMAAYTKYLEFLDNLGMEPSKYGCSYKTYIMYNALGEPVPDCGYHNGTLYFHKKKTDNE